MKASAFQAEDHRFDSDIPLQILRKVNKMTQESFTKEELQSLLLMAQSWLRWGRLVTLEERTQTEILIDRISRNLDNIER